MRHDMQHGFDGPKNNNFFTPPHPMLYQQLNQQKQKQQQYFKHQPQQPNQQQQLNWQQKALKRLVMFASHRARLSFMGWLVNKLL